MINRSINSTLVCQEWLALLTGWPLHRMVNSLLVEVSNRCLINRIALIICEYTGDGEKLQLWDIDKKRVNQVIGNETARWGQITCVKWLSGISDNREALCFGTGRGLVLIYHYFKKVVRPDLLSRWKRYSQSSRAVSRNCRTLLSFLSMNLLKPSTMT